MASHDKRRNLRAWRNKRDAAKARALRRYRNGIDTPCYFCKQPINMELPTKDKGSWTLHHLVPIANDGHIMGEAADAHKSCNSSYGDGTRINPLQGQTREW